MSNPITTRFYEMYGLRTGLSPAQARSSNKNEKRPLSPLEQEISSTTKIATQYLKWVGEDFVRVDNINAKSAFTELTELSQAFINKLPANIDKNLQLDIEDDILGNIALTIIRIHGRNNSSFNAEKLQAQTPLQRSVKSVVSLFLTQQVPLTEALKKKQTEQVNTLYRKIESDDTQLLNKIQKFINTEISDKLLQNLSTYSGDTQALQNIRQELQFEVAELQAQVVAYTTEEKYLNRLNPQAGGQAFHIGSEIAINNAKTTIEEAEKALVAYNRLRRYQHQLSLPGCDRLHYYKKLDILLEKVNHITDIDVQALAEEIKQTKAADQPNYVKEIFEKGSFPAIWEESFAQCPDTPSFTQDLTKIMIRNLSSEYITSFASGIGVVTNPHNNLKNTAKKAIEDLFLTACFQQGFFPKQAETILARRNLEDIQALQLNQIVQTQSAINPSYKKNLENCLNSLEKESPVKTTLLSYCCPKPGFFASLLLSILAFFSWFFRGCRRQDHAIQE